LRAPANDAVAIAQIETGLAIQAEVSNLFLAAE